MEKHQYNQGDILQFQRAIDRPRHLLVITKVIEPYYQVRHLNLDIIDWKIWDIKDLDDDPNFKLLVRGQ